MEHPGFFNRAGPFRLDEVVAATESSVSGDTDTALLIKDVRPLDEAGRDDLAFLDNTKYLRQFRATRAAACFVKEKNAADTPPQTAVLLSRQPYRSYALALTLFYPEALRCSTPGSDGWQTGQAVHESAVLEEGVTVEQGAIIGPEVRVGSGTTIASGAVIGRRVYIGRDCYIGPNTCITNSLIGDRVILHSGVCVGQDGFGFAMGPKGHLKVPQVGRVVIQDDVEVGANSAIDRGALRDTIVGEGTKIDNLVQIGHNAIIGRNCVIVAHAGVGGSAILEDFVVLGGKVSIAGHITIGAGAQIAGGSGVKGNIPPGQIWGGYTARPMRQWARELAILKKLALQTPGKQKKDNS